MALNGGSEYSQILRVSHNVDPPPGYRFISDATNLLLVQFCRDMTLAQGRLLYDIWDFYESRHLGYIVPVSILQAANRSITHAEDWFKFPVDKRIRLRNAQTEVLRMFPRIPAWSAKKLAETVVYERRSMGKMQMEELVVDHARHQYTSYEFRLEKRMNRQHERISKVEASVMIKRRMREVLMCWLSEDAASGDVATLYRRHRLFDAEEKDGGTSEAVLEDGWAMQDFDGAETVANVRSAAWAKL